MYKKGENVRLIGWSDSNYVGDIDDRKSTSEYVYMIGNGAISWSSKKEPILSLFLLLKLNMYQQLHVFAKESGCERF